MGMLQLDRPVNNNVLSITLM